MALERLDTWAAVHPGWRSRLQDLCDRTGCSPLSVWRSRELQARWYWCANNDCPPGRGCHGRPGACPSANPPDASFHETAQGLDVSLRPALVAAGLIAADESEGQVIVPCALAVDLDYEGDAIWAAHDLAPRFGLHFPIMPPAVRPDRAEPWHVQPTEAPGRNSPARWWSPFPALETYLRPVDPWAHVFVPILSG